MTATEPFVDDEYRRVPRPPPGARVAACRLPHAAAALIDAIEELTPARGQLPQRDPARAPLDDEVGRKQRAANPAELGWPGADGGLQFGTRLGGPTPKRLQHAGRD